MIKNLCKTTFLLLSLIMSFSIPVMASDYSEYFSTNKKIVHTSEYEVAAEFRIATPEENKAIDEVHGKLKSGDIRYIVIGDGVRIRSTPSLNGTVRGLLYTGDWFSTDGTIKTDDGIDWIKVTNSQNGVTGWLDFGFASGPISE